MMFTAVADRPSYDFRGGGEVYQVIVNSSLRHLLSRLSSYIDIVGYIGWAQLGFMTHPLSIHMYVVDYLGSKVVGGRLYRLPVYRTTN